MIKGITEDENILIKKYLKPYKDEYNFYFYGSRVKGNFEKASDLDILIKGTKPMPLEILSDLKVEFDNSILPYIVNFSDYNNISQEFYTLIKNDLISVY
jgi:predicted nucleotidyltransferase